MKKWLKRILSGGLILISSLLAIGFTYEHVSRVIAERNYSPDGELIDVDGHRLHVVTRGSGGPTVVFESGLGGNHLSWFKVQKEVSQFATTISYDRSGLLWSERGDNPKTAEAIADELIELLTKNKLDKPYILVGHSWAGITLRSFVSKYPEDIAGVIFVDASHPGQLIKGSTELKELMQPPEPLLLKAMSNFGVIRATFPEISPNTEKDDLFNTVRSSMIHKTIAGVIEEMENMEQMADEVSQLSFGEIPLTVITGTSPSKYADINDEALKTEMSDLWNELQQDLLLLSSNSQHVTAPESGHYVQIDQPKIVIDAIRDMIAKMKITTRD